MNRVVMSLSISAVLCVGFGGATCRSTPLPNLTDIAGDATPRLVVQSGQNTDVRRLVFSSDGRTLISAGDPNFDAASGDDRVFLWDTGTGALKETLYTGGSCVYSIALSPDGGLLAASTRGERNNAEDVDAIQLWDVRDGRLLRTLDPKLYPGTRVAFSHDGKMLVISGSDSYIRLLDVKTWQLIKKLQVGDFSGFDLTLSPDDRTVSVTLEHQVLILDVHTGTVIHEFNWTNDPDQPICFSPDSRMLALSDGENHIRILNLQTGESTRLQKKGAGVLLSGAVSPDDKTFASGGASSRFSLSDIRSDKTLWNMQESRFVRSVAFSPNGKSIAIGDDGFPQTTNIVLLSARTGKIERRLACPYQPVPLVRFTKDGSALISVHARTCSLDRPRGRDLITWDTRTAAPRRMQVCNMDEPPSFSSDGKTMILEAANVMQWENLKTGRIKSLQDSAKYYWFHPALSPDGKTVVVGYHRSHSHEHNLGAGPIVDGAMVIDTASDRILRTLPTPTSGIRDLDAMFTPDGLKVALWEPVKPGYQQEEPIDLWDWRRGVRVRSYRVGLDPGQGQRSHISLVAFAVRHNHLMPQRNPTPPERVAFSPDGRQLAKQEGFNSIILWSSDSSKRRKFEIANGPIRSLVFAPNGKTIACGNSLGIVTLIDTTTGKTLHILQIGGGSIHSLAFSPSGKALVAGGEDGRITWWDSASGRLLLTCQLFPAERPKNWIAYTPDGYYVGSPGVGAYIRWRVGDSLLSASTYAATYNKPALVRQVMGKL